LRQPRYELITVPQHIIQRGNNRQPKFFAEEDYPRYLDCLREAAKRHDGEIHAYVLMTNHVHLLVTPCKPLAIAKLMQSVGRRYVRYVNDRYRRSGTLWEGRYKASPVNNRNNTRNNRGIIGE
jgi:REP-associated tyrosine transposase